MERRRDIDDGRIIARRKEIEEGLRRTRVVEVDGSSSVVVGKGVCGNGSERERVIC
jgi:hypothetical protein